MGKKYTSMHTFSNDANEQQEILFILDKYYNDDASAEPISKASIVFTDIEVRNMFERLTSLLINEVLIIQSGSIISIYDDSLTFESIEEESRILSNKTKKPIIYVSNYDDDFIVFGVFQSGLRITNGKVGESLSMYDIIPERIDVDKIRKALPLNRTNILECINETDEIDIIENAIKSWLQVPLKLTIDCVQDSNEYYAEKFIEGRVHVYSRL